MDAPLGALSAAPRALLIAGPTASGKSALALAIAERVGGLIVNADALQVYREWRVLTARPSPSDMDRAPHRLYGHVSACDDGYSTGRWLRETTPILAEAAAQRRPVIIVGGSGLYFKALTEGLAEIPPTPIEIRKDCEARLARDGLDACVAALGAVDPESAAHIDTRNPRRVLRAMEVLEATGRGFAAWIARTPPAALPAAQAVTLRLTPDRARLRSRISERFEAMLAEGALEEARAVAALEASGAAPPAAPALGALGYRQLKALLAGEMARDAAAAAAIDQTRQYAKRQGTWLRNQMGAWPAAAPENGAELADLAEALAAALTAAAC